MTSSVAAVVCNGRPRIPDLVIDETWFSDPDISKELKECTLKHPFKFLSYAEGKCLLTVLIWLRRLWYVLSKPLAGHAAWKFVKEKVIDMVAIKW